jgi:superoxide dismutase, Cu-Zn family
MSRVMTLVAGAVAAVGLYLSPGATAVAANGEHRAELRDASGALVGSVKFQNASGGNVAVTISIESATPGFHGIHIHANDNPANGEGCVPPTFASADGHYSTTPGATHGAHSGDLPNVLVTPDGRGALSLVTDRFQLEELSGRAVIFHTGVDNHANVPTAGGPNDYLPITQGAMTLTASTGNAGGRTACGVID